MKCYCGFISDAKKLEESASGGFATALGIHVIDNGGVVYGVAFSGDFRRAEYRRVDKIDDLLPLMGSKYVMPHTNNCFETVISDIKSNKVVAFFGLPCITGSLLELVERKEHAFRNNLILVDLICQGPTPDSVLSQYIDNLEKRNKAKIVSLNMRYKREGWGQGKSFLRAEFSNKKMYTAELSKTDFGIAFGKMALPGCFSCKYKAENHSSDITIGDYWGIRREDSGYNPYGTSILLVRSERGDGIIKEMDNFELFDADIDRAICGNPRYATSLARTKQNEDFVQNFNRYGLHGACIRSLSIRRKILRYVPKYIKSFVVAVYNVISK